jgi:LemA protein
MTGGILLPALAGVFGLLLLGGVAWWALSIYNRLVRVDERCENAWSDIEVTLAQRQDLLEKLVDAARQAMEYERDTLQQLVEAREAAGSAATPAEHAAADAVVREALASLNVAARAEDYPDLEAVETLATLQNEVASIEEQIADRRELYNESVTVYNTLIRQFPYVLLAGSLGHERRELFDAPDAELADVDLGDLFAAEPVTGGE